MHIDIRKAQLIIRYWFLAKEYYDSLKAFELARTTHKGFRKDGYTPEFYHPLALVFYLKTLHKSLLYPQEALTVALIHDLGEDYRITEDYIKESFGSRTAAAFWRITKKNEEMQKTTKAYYDTLAECPISSIIKAADRIHNHQTMVGVFSKKKREEYILESQEYVLPMIKKARRLFPEQESAYENAKHILLSQIELIDSIR